MARRAKAEGTLRHACHEQNEEEVREARVEMRAQMREPGWIAGILS